MQTNPVFVVKRLEIEPLEPWQGRHETQRAKCCAHVVSNLNLDHSSPSFESGWGTTSYLLRVPRIWASFCRKMTTICICITNHSVGARLAQGLAQAVTAPSASKLLASKKQTTKMAQGWRKVGARGHKKTGLEPGHGRHETQRTKCCTTVVSNLSLDHSSPNFESGWGTTSYLLRVPRIWASFCWTIINNLNYVEK